MPWTTPDFVEINLSGEVTAYVNVEEDEPAKAQPEIASPAATANKQSAQDAPA
jgi:coenzyme PQQ precursor peptide PqqA